MEFHRAFDVLVKTPSASNLRETWRARWGRSKKQRTAARLTALAEGVPSLHEGPTAIVRLCRVSPRELDDDNLRGALKACRDGIADALGVDDRNPRVVWEYDQKQGKPSRVRVEIAMKISG